MGRPPKSQTVHSEDLLRCARTLLESGHLLDATIGVQGKTFRAHCLVLAAYSCYFKSAMTDEENHINYIFALDHLNITCNAFKIILDYMYSGVLKFVEEDLAEVEHVAVELQVNSAINLVERMKQTKEQNRQHLEAKRHRKLQRQLIREAREAKKALIERDEDLEDPSRMQLHQLMADCINNVEALKESVEGKDKATTNKEDRELPQSSTTRELLSTDHDESTIQDSGNDWENGQKLVSLQLSVEPDSLADSEESSELSSSDSEQEDDNDPDFNVNACDDPLDDLDFDIPQGEVKKETSKVLKNDLPTKRKRGRPPKAAVISKNSGSAQEEKERNELSTALRKQKGLPPMVDTHDDCNNESAHEMPTKISKPDEDTHKQCKRKRGRPRGSKNKTKSSMMSSLVKAARRRGRPPQSVNKATESSMDRPKRKRMKLEQEEDLWTMHDKEVNMFQCPECPYRTRLDKVFRLHRRRHTGYKPYACQYCGKGFIDRKYLVPHERSHTGERPYKCEHCPAAFYDRKHLNRHVKRHTGQRDYLCTECGMAFFDNDTLKRHHQAVHLNLRPYKCDAEGCGYAAKDPSALHQHKQQHSKDGAGILCDLCGKTFTNMNGLRIHKITHKEAKFQCEHCSFTAHYKHVLRNHCLRLHGVNLEGEQAIRSVKCDHCDFTCFTKQERHLHMLKKHLLERPHKCPICDFATVDKGSLKKHLNTHTGVTPYECEVCGRRFSQHSGYARHVRAHTGEKPFSCRLCNKTYADKKSLNTHLYGHANAKPYVCHICSVFGATRQEHLRKHIIKQHGSDVFEEYKKKGLCRPTLDADEAAVVSGNSSHLDVSQINASSEQLNAIHGIGEIQLNQSPQLGSQQQGSQQQHNIIMVTSNTQQHQQVVMNQMRVYQDPKMAASQPMVVLPTTQTLMTSFTPQLVDQGDVRQTQLGHLTTVNMADLTLTPLTVQQQPDMVLQPPQQPTLTRYYMSSLN